MEHLNVLNHALDGHHHPSILQVESVQLDSMSGFDFEEFLVRVLTRLHYGQVDKLIPAEGGGRHILLNTYNGLMLVECRHTADAPVGRALVKKLHSSVKSSHAIKGMLVTTGHFTEDAVEIAASSSLPIELVDSSRLAEMALRANITIVSKLQKLAIWTYPLPGIELTRFALAQYMDSILEGHPRSASTLLNVEKRSINYQPVYAVTYDVDAIFATSIGTVHHEHAINATLILNGQNGELFDKERADFFSDQTPERLMQMTEELNGKLPAFELDATTLKIRIKGIVADSHTKNVSYRALRNNRVYHKTCRPNESDITIRDIRQAYLPSFEVRFRVLDTDYNCSMVQTPKGQVRITVDNVRSCGTCNSHIDSTGIFCDTCGQGTHVGGFRLRNIHGFRCTRCKRTTCRTHGYWNRRFLVSKEMLCQTCATVARQKGRKVQKFKPISDMSHDSL